ncbi:MAG TPA: glycosyltransferase family 2 protein [Anaerolineales bacterium]|nr:glycosyltransferase family 2 protein [Anaerolineales bacterium]
MKIFGFLFWVCVLLIAYVYVGYPIILAALARLRRKTKEYPVITPQVSILIAAYNEQNVIGTKLENTLALEYPKECLQVVVAADGSDDHTPQTVETFAERGVELSYDFRRRGKMAAINRALPRLKHEIIVFSDANNLYAKDALLELVKPFSDPKVGAVTGSKNIMDDPDAHAKADGLYWRYESAIKKYETALGSCTGVTGEILAIRRSLYQPPPDHVINDDFFIGMGVLRQGYRLVYAPAAHSYEHASLTEQDEAVRRARIVAGRYQAMLMSGSVLPWRSPVLVWQVVSHKFMRPLVPFLMIIAFLVTLAACIWQLAPTNLGWLYLAAPYNILFLVAEILICILAIFGSSLKDKGLLGKILYLPTFLVNSNLAAILGLYSFFTGKQTSLWRRARRRGESV